MKPTRSLLAPLLAAPLALGRGALAQTEPAVVVERPWSPETLRALLLAWGLDLLGAILILVVGWIVANQAARLVRRSAEASDRVDRTLALVLARIARLGVLAIAFYAVLSRFGVDMAALLAVFGAAGLAIGLALQGTLSNVAAGAMLLSLRPFQVGDAVDVGGSAGVVEEVGLFVTRMRTFDGVPVHLPNSMVWGTEIKNYSAADRRRFDLVVGIGYGEDVGRALEVLRETVAADPRVLAEPEPTVGVQGLADSSVNLLARFWAMRDDFLGAQMSLTQRVKERFDEEGIEIPFPRQDLHIRRDPPSAQA